MDFEKLFEPIRLGGMELRNRIVQPPMGTGFSSEGGFVSQRLKEFYEARARGGAGLIVVEAATVDFDAGRSADVQLANAADRHLPGLAELAAVIKNCGARAAIQLHHAGREARTAVQPVAPSVVPIAASRFGEPRALTVEEIEQLVRAFAVAAERAVRAGFEALELHGASGYLFAQFLSPATNTRTDAYGGDIAGRSRFLAETLTAVKDAVGPGFPVWPRLNVSEFGVERGATVEDMKEAAVLLQEAGADAIHLSAFGTGAEAIVSLPVVPGALLPYVAAIKKRLRIPVIAVGRLTPGLGERALREGTADLVAIGRGLLADPELPNKVASGRLEEVRPCIACATCIPEGKFHGDRAWESFSGIHCAVNPALGREREYEVKVAGRPKRVTVIGGGPAGMEAARVLALRGHGVTLLERDDRLGGLLPLVARGPYKEQIGELCGYLAGELVRLGVDVRLETDVSAGLVESLEPEMVVVATGATPLVPDIPGLDGTNAVTAVDVLGGAVEPGERVLVIGGHWECDVADFLSAAGKRVTVATTGRRLATGTRTSLRRWLLDRLLSRGVELLAGVSYQEFGSSGLVLTTREGEARTIPADTVVLASGGRPRTRLSELLKDSVPEVHCIGDCVQPRSIMAAIHDGARVGRM